MPIAINGSGTLTGISVGGLPDGIVDADMLASNAVTAGKLASGVGGKLLQFLQTVKSDTFSTSISAGGQSSEVSGLTVNITPSNASNKILIRVVINVGANTSNRMVAFRIRKDGSTLSGARGDTDGSRAVVTSGTNIDALSRTNCIVGEYLDTAGGTSQITYGIVLRHGDTSSQTITINKSESNDDDDAYSFRTISTISVMEIAA